MRNLTALLLLLLLLCSLHRVFSVHGFDYKTECCSTTTRIKVPLKNIVTYWRINNSNCPIDAIVFQTLNKEQNTQRKVCVDPKAPWVNSHMRKVDLKNKATLSAKL
ncbi:monocyte chemotactic protein 1B-like [Neoarius graeffei]|uniref:monocyte chemotactic protein 1B-like n=1 Tax=Neoarius graeffei TaxID=443677 RepID=UPI00298C92EA|nr:monocyte chemotactic protein 1B-like [Neoarius graeffei]